MSLYDVVFRLGFVHMDPERAHHLAFTAIRASHAVGLGRLVRRACRPDPSLATRVMGIDFPSPFGLAAGFDKDGVGYGGLADLGFGHVEVGTITAKAQPGNPKPRLFRLVADRALINRMGFNNRGAADAQHRLAKRRRDGSVVVGINIGKSRVTPVEEAIPDYVDSARRLAPLADYLAINVSSPNTPGLRSLQAVDHLRPLLTAVRAAAGQTPVAVKIAPDMSDEEITAVADLAVELGLAGIIATNTTIGRDGLKTPRQLVDDIGAGGLSGVPLAARSLEVLRLLASHLDGRLAIISVGGVRTAEDVAERLEAGASLVQGYSEFIYSGPLWVRGINRGLAQLGVGRGGAR